MPQTPDPAAQARADAARQRAESQIRPDGGRFGSDRVRELPRADEEAAAAPAPTGQEPAPAAGQQPPAADPAQPGEQQLPAGDEPPAGEEIDEVVDEGEGAEGEEELGALDVVLQGGRDGEEYVLSFTDERQANAVRHLQNQAAKVKDVEALQQRAQQDLDQAQTLRMEIQMDPVGFILDSLQQEPELLAHIAGYLVTRPDLQRHLKPVFDGLADDPEKVQLRMDRDRVTMRDQFRKVADEQRQIDTNLTAVQQTVGQLVPTGLSTAQQKQFRHDCLRDLQQYADRHDLLIVPIQDVPVILASRLRAWGVDPVQAMDRVTARPEKKNGQPAARRSLATQPPAAGGQPNGTQGPPKAPAKTGKQFVQGQRVKRAAASVASSGAGVPGSTSLTPPPGMTIEQATAWHRTELSKRGAARTAGQQPV